jgi:hypothetical protein
MVSVSFGIEKSGHLKHPTLEMIRKIHKNPKFTIFVVDILFRQDGGVFAKGVMR